MAASTARAAPYPADTIARGWRFELDMETVKRSDTWKLARTGAIRGALLLLWAEAWQERPCGSLPDDDELIALMLDMTLPAFRKQRAVLLRGWWKAEDGRLYHDVIASRVLAMLEKRAKDAARIQRHRERRTESPASNADVTRDTHVTDALSAREFATKHQAPSTIKEGGEYFADAGACADEPDLEGFVPTPGGAVCLALKQAGVLKANPGHPRLLALIEAGATVDEFVAFVDKAQGMNDPFAYVLGCVEGERKRAAESLQGMHVGPMRVAAGRRSKTEERVAFLDELTGRNREHARTVDSTLVVDVDARRVD